MFVNEGGGRYKCKVKAAFKFKYDGIGMVGGCTETGGGCGLLFGWMNVRPRKTKDY